MALAACSTLALGLLAASAAVRIPLVAELGHWSLPVLGHNSPPGLAVALLAGMLLGVAVLTVSGFAVRRYRSLAGAYREARCLPGHGQTVVVADEVADADWAGCPRRGGRADSRHRCEGPTACGRRCPWWPRR